MRQTLLATASLVGLTGLAACSSNGADTPAALLTVEEVVGGFAGRTDGALAPQTDYALLFDAMPASAVVSVGAYVPEAGGTVAQGVRIDFGGSGAALVVDELRAYDLDASALGATEGARLASRLDLRGVSFEGLGALTEALTEEMATGMAEGMLGEEGIAFDQEVGRYDYRMERVVLDGFTVAAMPETATVTTTLDDGTEHSFTALKDYLAVAGLFGADRFLATGVTGEMAMTQTVGSATTKTFDDVPSEGDEPLEETVEPITSEVQTSFRMDEFGGADWRGFDIGMEFIRGFETQTRQTTNGVAVPATDFRGEEIVIRDLSLSKLVPYILAETMPGADETDLMSLGRWDMTNLTQLVGGQAFATTEAATLDMTAWHGLMPERITYQSTDRIEVGGLIEMVRGQIDAVGDATAAEAGDAVTADAPDMAMIETLATALRDAGLETIRSEGRLDYAYAPDTGAMTFNVGSDTEEMGEFAFGLDMALPTYAQFAETPLEPENRLDAMIEGEMERLPLTALLADEVALERMTLLLDDEGGLDALLQVVIAVAEASDVEEEPSLAMLRGQTPQGLRQMLAGLVTMTSVQAAAAVPQVTDYAGALSGWLSQGGELRLVLDPAEPLDAETLAALEAMEGGPAAAIDRLGLAVTHEGPDAD